MHHLFITIQCIGLAILVVDLFYVFTRNPSRLQVILLGLIVAIIVNFSGETMEILATTQDLALAGARFAYVGKPMILFCMFLLVVIYCRIKVPRWVAICLFCIQITVSAIAITSPYHTLFYSTISFVDTGYFPHLVLGKGILYWLYTLVIIGYFTFYLICILSFLKKARNKYERNQAISLLAMECVMMAGLILFLAGVTGGYDTTLAAYVIAVLILSRIIARYNLFDTMTLAHDQALADSSDGLVVFDQRDDLVYVNSTAREVIRTLTPNMSGLKQEKPTVRYLFASDSISYSLDESWSELLKEIFESLCADPKPLEIDEKVYRVRSRRLEQKGISFGVIYEVLDITESHTYAARLEHDVYQKTQEIRSIQHQVIISFANIVEARDDITGMHIKNTSNYVRILARTLHHMLLEDYQGDPDRIGQELGPDYAQLLDKRFVDTIISVAPLHDLGKISVPDDVLQKPGKLTDEEFSLIKLHPARGAEIIESTLRGVESDYYVGTAKVVALCHHEKWNGTGYPLGVSGFDIPLAARIMAVADVYDALRSKRSYKEGFSKEKSRRIIEESSGSHFDPLVVSAFIRSIDFIEAV